MKKSGAQPGNKNAIKHGYRNTPTYRVWIDMRRRCTNSRYPAYKWYGARGIKYCQRWESFENFLADMGEVSNGMTLDRIKNDGHYQPDNCRWATQREQQNNRRGLKLLTHHGKTQTMKAWAAELGIGQTCLQYRIAAGWSIERALTAKDHRRAS